MLSVLRTEEELRTLHRTFGHSSVRALQMLLERPNGSNLERNIVNYKEEMKEDCTVCKKKMTVPRGLKLTVGTASLRFGYRVHFDIVFIPGRPVVHIVGKRTDFCAAPFLGSRLRMESGTGPSIRSLWSTSVQQIFL